MTQLHTSHERYQKLIESEDFQRVEQFLEDHCMYVETLAKERTGTAGGPNDLTIWRYVMDRTGAEAILWARADDDGRQWGVATSAGTDVDAELDALHRAAGYGPALDEIELADVVTTEDGVNVTVDFDDGMAFATFRHTIDRLGATDLIVKPQHSDDGRVTFRFEDTDKARTLARLVRCMTRDCY